MARKNLYINNTNIGTYGIYISSDTVLDSPSFDYKAYAVPGRNGTVLQYGKRMDNVVRKFSCYVPDGTNTKTALTSLKKLIFANPGYLKISSDYETDTYQIGYLAQEITVKPFNRYRTATFDLYFSCKPQKFFNTQVYQSVSNNHMTNFRGALTRSNGFITSLFNSLPAQVIPNDKCFMVFGINTAVSSGASLTNISASWSEGDCFVAVCISGKQKPYKAEDFKELIGFNTSSISSYSKTTTKGGDVRFIVPTKTKGTFTFTYTVGGNTTTITTSDLASITSTITEPTAVGCHSLFRTSYDFPGSFSVGDFETNAAIFKYSYLGNETGECSIIWRSDLIDATTLETLKDYSTYVSFDGVYNFETYIDFETNEILIKKTGMPDLNFGAYFEIDGNVPQTGTDKIEVQAHYCCLGGRIYCDWWTV